jgi:hypothetical protein
MWAAAIAASLGRQSGAVDGSEPDSKSPCWDGSDMLLSLKDQTGRIELARAGNCV